MGGIKYSDIVYHCDDLSLNENFRRKRIEGNSTKNKKQRRTGRRRVGIYIRKGL